MYMTKKRSFRYIHMMKMGLDLSNKSHCKIRKVVYSFPHQNLSITWSGRTWRPARLKAQPQPRKFSIYMCAHAPTTPAWKTIVVVSTTV